MSESSALLPKAQAPAPAPRFGPISRVFLTSLLVAIAFAFTQTSLLYALRIMTCDEYYKTHTWSGDGDRCALPWIESDTAKAVAIAGATTTFFSVLNVFVVNVMVKRYGVKSAMFQQTALAAVRNLTQIYAQLCGGKHGIIIIQLSQVFNILGSGGGYQLAGNSYIAALADHGKLTGLFGVLGGVYMFGGAIGYAGGGLAFRYIGELAPFHGAFGLLVTATLFGAAFLPYVPPPAVGTESTKTSHLSFLRIFSPHRHLNNGSSKWDFNLCLLGTGAFFSVLATGNVPTGLQLVGTNVFGFKPDDSGVMMAFTFLVNGFFLSFCFPRIIASGRHMLSRRQHISAGQTHEEPDYIYEVEGRIAVDNVVPIDDDFHSGIDNETSFDLYFVQWSIFLDALLTSGVYFSTRGLHLFIAAGILPFASGTGPAAKGVTMELVTPERRADALAAIALVEKIASVLTTGIFGYVFSVLSEQRHPMVLFLVNGAVALLAFLLLTPVRIRPARGATGGAIYN